VKHSIKVTLLLLALFLATQLIGLFVVNFYSPQIISQADLNGTITNITTYNLPYGMDPPQGIKPETTLYSIIFALVFAVILMLILMKYHAEIFLRIWFFIVVALALGITFNAFILSVSSIAYSSIIAIIVALFFAYLKIFKRNILVHNATELLIYPGIAVIFVPLLNLWTIVLLLVLISIYDIYAVWHAGFMQKMAHYQIKTLRLFSGFFVPYLGARERELLKKAKGKAKSKKVKVNVAILGGGDVVFPIIMAGVVFRALGLIPALLIVLGATLALAGLFYASKKGKFYPAMPFITAGCFVGLVIAYLI
jgi:presenilin-like A22 family membrane protease